MRDFLVGWVEISLKFQLRDVPDFRQMARLLPFSRGSRPSFNHTAGPSTTWCAFACGDGTKTRALWRLQRGRRFSPEIAKRQAPALFRSSGSIRMQLSV